MTITSIALVNGALALLMLVALAAVFRLGFRIDHISNEASVLPASPTPLDLHADDLAQAA